MFGQACCPGALPRNFRSVTCQHPPGMETGVKGSSSYRCPTSSPCFFFHIASQIIPLCSPFSSRLTYPTIPDPLSTSASDTNDGVLSNHVFKTGLIERVNRKGARMPPSQKGEKNVFLFTQKKIF